VRAGGDWNVVPGKLAVRAGYSFETPAQPEAWTRVDFLPFERHGAHVGATLRVGDVDLSAGYAHVFQPDRVVRNGSAKQIEAFPPGECHEDVPAYCGSVVNEGTYESSFDTLSIGATFNF